MSAVLCRSFDISLLFFFFNDTATTEIYTLSLHDALPIFALCALLVAPALLDSGEFPRTLYAYRGKDRKSTRLNSSHRCISYAVFCLKKKKKKTTQSYRTETQNKARTKPDAHSIAVLRGPS